MVRVEVPLGEYSSSAGTGVIISTNARGTAELLTAYHVIDERPLGTMTVTAEDASGVKEYDAKIVDYDSTEDIALLSICCSSTFQVAKLSEELPELGEPVFAVGYGEYSKTPTTYRGRIIGIRGESLGTDAALVKGNSGGPLISGRTGEVIGINLAVTVEPDSYEWRFVLDDAEREVLRDLLGIWPSGTGIALSSQTIIQSFALFPPTSRLTPAPQALTEIEYMAEVTPIGLELARILEEEIDETFILQDPSSPQRQKVTTQLLAVADSITEVQGVPAVCREHYDYLSQMAARIYEYRDDQLPSTLLALVDVMNAMTARARGFNC